MMLSEKEKPNILVINIDDLGFHDLSSNGSKIYQTPNIDGLQKQSYSFERAYANYPRCLPSRYALMTSTYPVAEFNHASVTETAGNENFVRQFNTAGYQSYFVGKWHLGSGDNSPEGFGFSASYAAGGAGGVASHFYPFNTKKVINPLGQEVQPIPDVEEEGKEGDYLDDVLTNRLIGFLENRDVAKPFLAVLSPYSVHTPFEANQMDIVRNEQEIKTYDFGKTPEYVPEGNGFTKMRQDNAIYAAMVENTDKNIGKILKTLDRLKISRNTIVVFTSDHGGYSNRGDVARALATTNYPLRAGKGHLYEGGIRVPLLVRWPGHIRADKDDQNIVLLMDLFPSLLEMATGNTMKNIDGASFKNVLEKKESWAGRNVFFYENMARPKMTGDFPGMAMISGNYKMIHLFGNDKFELYDLKNDTSEQNDIAQARPDLAEMMKAQMTDWKNKYVNTEKHK